MVNFRTGGLIILAAATSVIAQPRLASEIESLGADQERDVIVIYKAGAQERGRQSIMGKGAKHRRALESIGGDHFTVKGQHVRALEHDPDIDSIDPDREVYSTLDTATASINISAARSAGWTGSGVGVAVLDSGTTGLVPAVYEQDFTGSPYGATDVFGHGTHVSGIVASSLGIGLDAGGVILKRDMLGVAPGVSLVSLKVLNNYGVGTDSAVISAIDRAIALKSTYNIRVINLSLGRPVTVSYKSDPLCLAVEKAWKAGIVVVVAAGNYGRLNTAGNQGYGTITAPGNDPFVITVGGMKSMNTTLRSDDRIASYSSKGPSQVDLVVKPDLVAPGNQIISVCNMASFFSKSGLYSTNSVTQLLIDLLWNGPTGMPDTWFYRLNGTSMAAPMVSGAAALLLQKTPNLTPDQVKARLMRTASKSFPATSSAVDPSTGATYVSSYDLFTVGAGYLDVAAALADTTSFSGSAQSPTAMLVNNKPVLVMPTGSGFSTSTSVVWGTSLVWGTTTTSGSSIVWGTSLVWGTGGTQGYSIIWGTGGTAGSSIIWGTADLRSTSAMNVLVRGE